MKHFLLVFFFCVPSAFAAVWQIDTAHSSATFRVKHLVIATVTGKMSGIKGSVTIDEKDITKSKVTAELDPATIWTANVKRDNHLKNADFLDVKKYLHIKFVSTAVKKIKEGQLEVTGNLTLKSVTKKVVLQVEGPTRAVKARGLLHKGVTVQVTINRQDFGVRWSDTMETGGLVVGNEVKITLDLELTRKP